MRSLSEPWFVPMRIATPTTCNPFCLETGGAAIDRIFLYNGVTLPKVSSKPIDALLFSIGVLRVDGNAHVGHRGVARGGVSGRVETGGAQGQGDHDALAHAARELVRVLVDALLGGLDAGLLEQADGARSCLVGAHRQVREDGFGELAAYRV